MILFPLKAQMCLLLPCCRKKIFGFLFLLYAESQTTSDCLQTGFFHTLYYDLLGRHYLFVTGIPPMAISPFCKIQHF